MGANNHDEPITTSVHSGAEHLSISFRAAWAPPCRQASDINSESRQAVRMEWAQHAVRQVVGHREIAVMTCSYVSFVVELSIKKI